MTRPDTKPVQSYLPQDLYDQLAAYARDEDRSMGSVVRVAVRRYLAAAHGGAA